MTVSCRSLPTTRTKSGSRHAGLNSGQRARGPKIFRTLIHLGLLGNAKPTPGKRSSSAYLELACCIRRIYRSPGNTTWPGPSWWCLNLGTSHAVPSLRLHELLSHNQTNLPPPPPQTGRPGTGELLHKMKFVLCLSSASWPAWLGNFLTFPAWGRGQQ